MKGYKVFNKNWICRDYDFKDESGNVEGTIHEIEEEPKLCEVGFHYCEILINCFNYYDFNPKNKVAEIEIIGKTDGNSGDKKCSNKIKIIKELNWSEVLTLVNVGHSNTGYRNTGNWNTGDGNTGNLNAGDRNTGYRNTGNWNAGDRNTGNWNAGDRNIGNWNAGSNNIGYFNTTTPKKIIVFEKECDIETWKKAYKPRFLYFKLTEFVDENKMTEKEKKENPDYKTIGGFLKVYSYKEAFMESWKNADKEDREKIRELPNFDKEIFYEISGIDIDKD